MTYDNPGGGALDYFPCRYGTSKLILRGPRRRLQGEYFAFLGGTETYGRFLETPYPALVEQITGMRSVNLGCINAGPDAYLNDKTLMDICRRATMTVVQVVGAQNMSNRCYSVHPRRNDRFLRASSLLRTVYPDVDFTEFHFTRHLLAALEKGSAERFAMVRKELKQSWSSRMTKLIAAIGRPVVLLWLADHAPEDPDRIAPASSDPLFVDRDMLAALARGGNRTVQIIGSAQEIAAGRTGMVHAAMEGPATEGVLGPVVHQRAAEALVQVLTATA